MKNLFFFGAFILFISCEKEESYPQIDGSYNITEHSRITETDSTDLIPPNLSSYRRNFSIFNYESNAYSTTYLVASSAGVQASLPSEFKLLNQGQIIEIKESDGAIRNYRINYLSNIKMEFTLETSIFKEKIVLTK